VRRCLTCELLLELENIAAPVMQASRIMHFARLLASPTCTAHAPRSSRGRSFASQLSH
jgi:hypothetical protein